MPNAPFHTEFWESGLHFQFPNNWRVVSYDQHRFFQAISGAGLSGVDFLGIAPDGRLWMIEVKNYSNGPDPIPGKGPSDQLLKDSASLEARLLKKAKDTRRGIAVVSAFLERKWIYRRWFQYQQRWTFLQAWFPEWGFWSELSGAPISEIIYGVVLELALPDVEAASVRRRIAEGLSKELPFRVAVFPHNGLPW